jgi:hypothetical protein
MACSGVANTKGAYRAAMMGGGGGATTWMIDEVATEDEDEEGMDSTEGVICVLVMGDRTLGIRGCKTVGSKMIPVTKLSDHVLTKLCYGKVLRSGF